MHFIEIVVVMIAVLLVAIPVVLGVLGKRKNCGTACKHCNRCCHYHKRKNEEI